MESSKWQLNPRFLKAQPQILEFQVSHQNLGEIPYPVGITPNSDFERKIIFSKNISHAI